MKHVSLLRRGLLLLALLASGGLAAQAQGVTIGAAGAPDASAALEVRTTSQGLLLPRLTIAQRQAIASPAVGLLVYQTDGAQPGLWYNQASGGWTFLSSVGPTGATGPQGPAATPTYVPDPALSMAPVTTLTPSNSTFVETLLGHTVSFKQWHFNAIAAYRNIVYLGGIVYSDFDYTTNTPSSPFSGYNGYGPLFKLDLTTMVLSQVSTVRGSNYIPMNVNGIAINDAGNMLYATAADNSVYSYNMSSGAIGQIATGFNNPQGIACLGSYLYIADTGTNCIRKLYATGGTGNGTLFAGSPTGVAGTADGAGSQARFNAPSGIANRLKGADPSGIFFVTDTNNHRIRQINASTGAVSTIVGNTAGYLDGPVGSLSSPSTPQLNGPVGITYSTASDAIYVTDVNNNCVRKIELSDGIPQRVSTVAGSGIVGLANGAGYKARFNGLTGIAGVPNTNTILILDTGNNAIRQVIP